MPRSIEVLGAEVLIGVASVLRTERADLFEEVWNVLCSIGPDGNPIVEVVGRLHTVCYGRAAPSGNFVCLNGCLRLDGDRDIVAMGILNVLRHFEEWGLRNRLRILGQDEELKEVRDPVDPDRLDIAIVPFSPELEYKGGNSSSMER